LASQLQKKQLVASDQPTKRGTIAVIEHTQICSKVFPRETTCRDKPLFQNALPPDPRTLLLVLQILTFYSSKARIIRITIPCHSLDIKMTGAVELPIAVSLSF